MHTICTNSKDGRNFIADIGMIIIADIFAHKNLEYNKKQRFIQFRGQLLNNMGGCFLFSAYFRIHKILKIFW